MDRPQLLEAFRDFFHYGRKEHLRQAYLKISALSDPGSDPQKIDWDLEEFTFNKLFTGPMAPLAPAVASVYLDPEGLIQGNVTAEIRTFYESIGLRIDEIGSEPEDSLAYELDACRHLLLLADKLPEAADAYAGFIHEHIALWVPEFSTRAMEHCQESVAVKNVLMLLSEWVENETGNTTQDKEME
ncbi:TorD/DmsD family molecular chaperone [Desulfosediminicola flagellatus]|uniref:TorD/DmsD family molecular chaperone n=1 Tax=Desulfosediminicola flagellatus TaxID=2569541 RepID=UPI00142EC06E|nr:molecular chaperone TorD family protein [Desulfosediminicola flagellatus]